MALDNRGYDRTMGEPAIRIDELTVRFGEQPVLERFSLGLETGAKATLTGKKGKKGGKKGKRGTVTIYCCSLFIYFNPMIQVSINGYCPPFPLPPFPSPFPPLFHKAMDSSA